MKSRRLAAPLGWFAAVLLCWPTASHADRYRLQVASVPDQVFMYFVEDRTLPGMEAFLDDKQRSRFVLFRDRQPQPVEIRTSEQSEPLSVDAALPKRNDPWGATIWDGEPGQLAVFRVRGRQRNYQKLKRVAVHAGGALTRFPVRPHSVFRTGADTGAGHNRKLCDARPGARRFRGLGETAGGLL